MTNRQSQENTASTDGLMGYQEAADYLKFSTRKVWSLVNSKQIACVRIGRSVRFRRSDLETFVRQNLEKASKAGAAAA